MSVGSSSCGLSPIATLLAVVTALLALPTLAAEPSYEAEVTGLHVFALSGPGIGYYPTQALRRGEKVVVVGQRLGEWLAIVPPPGSFSWIPARMVEEQADGSGLVTADDAQVRVGSRLNDAHHVFQVSLKKGDRVDILDQTYLKEDQNVALWYKIHSPRDEVRYVAADQVAVPGVAPTAVNGAAIAAAALDAANAAPVNRLPPANAIGSADGQGTIAPGVPIPEFQPPADAARQSPLGQAPLSQARVVTNRVIPPAQPIGEVSTPDVPLVNASLSKMDPVTTPTPQAGPEATAPAAIVDDPQLPFDQRLASFENQLHMLRARDPRSWDLANAKKIAETIQTAATTPEQQNKALASLSEVSRLEGLEQQYERALRQWELTRQKDDELEALQRRLENQARSVMPMFTAEGVLEQGTMTIDDRPSLVLKGKDGYVTHYVLPTPGMKADRYVGAKVGLFGKLSNRPGLPNPVLELEQLTPLDGP